VVARYTQIGKTIVADFDFTLGSTSAVGTPCQVALPVTAADVYDFADNTVGQCYMRDANGGNGDILGFCRLESATAMRALIQYVDGGIIYLRPLGITTTLPFTWTTNDGIHMRVTYEAA
jgi:hypothetical protein